jgi:hypothetical protein
MHQNLPYEDTLRRYLLGLLPEPEIEEVEENLLSNESLSETADLVEDEIIEDYLDGTLDERSRRAVETHFLRPAAHREKLRFARLLKQHFDQERLVPASSAPLPGWSPQSRTLLMGGALGMILLSSLSAYLMVAQIDLRKKVHEAKIAQDALQTQLIQERQSAQLAGGPTSSIAKIDLRPGVTRSPGVSIPKVTTGPSTLVIRVDVLLPGMSSSRFRVHLENEQGQSLWSQTGLKPIPAPPLWRLVVDLPGHGIDPGHYDLIASPEAGQVTPLTYPLDIDSRQ